MSRLIIEDAPPNKPYAIVNTRECSDLACVNPEHLVYVDEPTMQEHYALIRKMKKEHYKSLTLLEANSYLLADKEKLNPLMGSYPQAVVDSKIIGKPTPTEWALGLLSLGILTGDKEGHLYVMKGEEWKLPTSYKHAGIPFGYWLKGVSENLPLTRENLARIERATSVCDEAKCVNLEHMTIVNRRVEPIDIGLDVFDNIESELQAEQEERQKHMEEYENHKERVRETGRNINRVRQERKKLRMAKKEYEEAMNNQSEYRSRCDCPKIAFSNEFNANYAANIIKKQVRSKGYHNPASIRQGGKIKAYKCPMGEYWHVTTHA